MNVAKRMKWSPVEYAAAAVIAEEAGKEMLNRLDWMTLQPQVIVDLGCGTGNISMLLQERYPAATLLAIDFTPAMLEHAQTATPPKSITHLCADAVALPFKNQSVDLLIANFLLPWCDIKQILRECRRLLRPEGLLMLTALGPDTLQEWQGVFCNEDLPLRMDMHDVGDLLLAEGFADPVLDVDYYTTTFRDVNQLLQELRASGMLSQCANFNLPMTPSLSLSYEIIHAHAFAPLPTLERSASESGEVRIPIANLRRKKPGVLE